MGADLVKNVKRTSTLPAKDADKNDTAGLALAKWKENEDFVLRWITVTEFEAIVASFGETLGDRISTAGGRQALTKKLVNLNSDIDTGIMLIKNFLVFKYKKDAVSYYSQFGIEKAGRNYVLPRDRNRRKEALKLVVPAIEANGFTDDKYDAAWWQAAISSFNELSGSASTVDGTVSQKVSDKNELRKTIVKTLNALIKLLQANFPDTYKAVMRDWGFQKEKY